MWRVAKRCRSNKKDYIDAERSPDSITRACTETTKSIEKVHFAFSDYFFFAGMNIKPGAGAGCSHDIAHAKMSHASKPSGTTKQTKPLACNA